MDSSSRHAAGLLEVTRADSGAEGVSGDGAAPAPKRPPRARWRGELALPLASAVALCVALTLVFFYAPLEAQEGFLQKIFYLHVPLAIVTLCGFVFAGLMAIMHLRTGEARWDLRSYVAIHVSLIFGVAVLITGSIWAKGSWGHWWVWNEPTLVSFLIIMLLYATYQPLRFAIEDHERQARYASVFAITAGAFVPLNFIVVRLAPQYVHPRVLSSANNLPASMGFTFVVALVAVTLMYLTLWRFEIRAKETRFRLRAMRTRLLALEGEGPVRSAIHPGAGPEAAPAEAPQAPAPVGERPAQGQPDPAGAGAGPAGGRATGGRAPEAVIS